MKDAPDYAPQSSTLTIDWSEVHRRMDNARSIIEREFEPGPREKAHILRQRARMLARVADAATTSPAERISVVVFLLADETYAIESASVREVYPLKDLTPVPCAPPFIVGIINVRGQFLSVTDLRKFFDLADKARAEPSHVIIVHSDDMELGILADAVLGVQSMPVNDIQRPPLTLTGFPVEFLKGVTEERWVVLDMDRILTDKRIVVNEQM